MASARPSTNIKRHVANSSTENDSFFLESEKDHPPKRRHSITNCQLDYHRELNGNSKKHKHHPSLTLNHGFRSRYSPSKLSGKHDGHIQMCSNFENQNSPLDNESDHQDGFSLCKNGNTIDRESSSSFDFQDEKRSNCNRENRNSFPVDNPNNGFDHSENRNDLCTNCPDANRSVESLSKLIESDNLERLSSDYKNENHENDCRAESENVGHQTFPASNLDHYLLTINPFSDHIGQSKHNDTKSKTGNLDRELLNRANANLEDCGKSKKTAILYPSHLSLDFDNRILLNNTSNETEEQVSKKKSLTLDHRYLKRTKRADDFGDSRRFFEKSDQFENRFFNQNFNANELLRPLTVKKEYLRPSRSKLEEFGHSRKGKNEDLKPHQTNREEVGRKCDRKNEQTVSEEFARNEYSRTPQESHQSNSQGVGDGCIFKNEEEFEDLQSNPEEFYQNYNSKNKDLGLQQSNSQGVADGYNFKNKEEFEDLQSKPVEFYQNDNSKTKDLGLQQSNLQGVGDGYNFKNEEEFHRNDYVQNAHFQPSSQSNPEEFDRICNGKKEYLGVQQSNSQEVGDGYKFENKQINSEQDFDRSDDVGNKLLRPPGAFEGLEIERLENTRGGFCNIQEGKRGQPINSDQVGFCQNHNGRIIGEKINSYDDYCQANDPKDYGTIDGEKFENFEGRHRQTDYFPPKGLKDYDEQQCQQFENMQKVYLRRGEEDDETLLHQQLELLGKVQTKHCHGNCFQLQKDQGDYESKQYQQLEAFGSTKKIHRNDRCCQENAEDFRAVKHKQLEALGNGEKIHHRVGCDQETKGQEGYKAEKHQQLEAFENAEKILRHVGCCQENTNQNGSGIGEKIDHHVGCDQEDYKVAKHQQLKAFGNGEKILHRVGCDPEIKDQEGYKAEKHQHLKVFGNDEKILRHVGCCQENTEQENFRAVKHQLLKVLGNEEKIHHRVGCSQENKGQEVYRGVKPQQLEAFGNEEKIDHRVGCAQENEDQHQQLKAFGNGEKIHHHVEGDEVLCTNEIAPKHFGHHSKAIEKLQECSSIKNKCKQSCGNNSSSDTPEMIESTESIKSQSTARNSNKSTNDYCLNPDQRSFDDQRNKHKSTCSCHQEKNNCSCGKNQSSPRSDGRNLKENEKGKASGPNKKEDRRNSNVMFLENEEGNASGSNKKEDRRNLNVFLENEEWNASGSNKKEDRRNSNVMFPENEEGNASGSNKKEDRRNLNVFLENEEGDASGSNKKEDRRNLNVFLKNEKGNASDSTTKEDSRNLNVFLENEEGNASGSNKKEDRRNSNVMFPENEEGNASGSNKKEDRRNLNVFLENEEGDASGSNKKEDRRNLNVFLENEKGNASDSNTKEDSRNFNVFLENEEGNASGSNKKEDRRNSNVMFPENEEGNASGSNKKEDRRNLNVFLENEEGDASGSNKKEDRRNLNVFLENEKGNASDSNTKEDSRNFNVFLENEEGNASGSNTKEDSRNLNVMFPEIEKENERDTILKEDSGNLNFTFPKNEERNTEENHYRHNLKENDDIFLQEEEGNQSRSALVDSSPQFSSHQKGDIRSFLQKSENEFPTACSNNCISCPQFSRHQKDDVKSFLQETENQFPNACSNNSINNRLKQDNAYTSRERNQHPDACSNNCISCPQFSRHQEDDVSSFLPDNENQFPSACYNNSNNNLLKHDDAYTSRERNQLPGACSNNCISCPQFSRHQKDDVNSFLQESENQFPSACSNNSINNRLKHDNAYTSRERNQLPGAFISSRHQKDDVSSFLQENENQFPSAGSNNFTNNRLKHDDAYTSQHNPRKDRKITRECSCPQGLGHDAEFGLRKEADLDFLGLNETTSSENEAMDVLLQLDEVLNECLKETGEACEACNSNDFVNKNRDEYRLSRKISLEELEGKKQICIDSEKSQLKIDDFVKSKNSQLNHNVNTLPKKISPKDHDVEASEGYGINDDGSSEFIGGSKLNFNNDEHSLGRVVKLQELEGKAKIEVMQFCLRSESKDCSNLIDNEKQPIIHSADVNTKTILNNANRDITIEECLYDLDEYLRAIDNDSSSSKGSLRAAGKSHRNLGYINNEPDRTESDIQRPLSSCGSRADALTRNHAYRATIGAIKCGGGEERAMVLHRSAPGRVDNPSTRRTSEADGDEEVIDWSWLNDVEGAETVENHRPSTSVVVEESMATGDAKRPIWLRTSMRRLQPLPLPTNVDNADHAPATSSAMDNLTPAETNFGRPISAPSRLASVQRSRSRDRTSQNPAGRARSSSASSRSRRPRSLSSSVSSVVSSVDSTPTCTPTPAQTYNTNTTEEAANNNNNVRRSCERPARNNDMPEAESPLGQWPHSLSSTLAYIGCTLGIFNISRFAILSIHFGANFIFQFLIITFFIGLPIFTLQLCLGQQLGAGVIDMWKISPMFQGVGVSLLFFQTLTGIYSIVGTSWMFVYFRDAFVTKFERYRWAEPFIYYRNNIQPPINGSYKLTETIPDYLSGIVFQRHHLVSGNMYGTIKFQPAFNLAVVWMIVFVSLSKGLRSYGKVIYVFTLLPIFGMFVLCAKLLGMMPPELINNVFPETSWNEFFTNPRSWLAACQEAFLTWGMLGAAVMQIASHNKNKHLLQRDSSLIAVITVTILLLVAFLANTCVQILKVNGYSYQPDSFEKLSTYAFMRHKSDPLPPSLASTPVKYMVHNSFIVGDRINRPGYDSATESGYQVLRFATELIPATFAILGTDQVSPFWTVLFYFILILFGIAQQLAIWHCVITGIMAIKAKVLKSWETTITFFSCACGFILGLPMTTEFGIYVVYFMDLAIGGVWWLILILLLQIIAVFMVRGRPYSGDTLVTVLFHSNNYKCLLSWAPALLSFTWNVVLPVVLMVWCIAFFKNGNFRELFIWHHGPSLEYWPLWARQIGALLQLLPILAVPFIAVIQSYRYLNNGPNDILDRIQLLYRPPIGEHMDDLAVQEAAAAMNNNTTSPTTNIVAEDPPPKYTPPPSYTTATGARIAKLLRQSIRRSVRRIANALGESSGTRSRNTATTSRTPEPPPPDYNAVLVEMNQNQRDVSIAIPDGPYSRNNTIQRELATIATSSTGLTAADVACILRSSFRRSTLRTLRRNNAGTDQSMSSLSAENLIDSAAPIGETSLVLDLTSDSDNKDGNNTSSVI